MDEIRQIFAGRLVISTETLRTRIHGLVPLSFHEVLCPSQDGPKSLDGCVHGTSLSGLLG